MGSQWCVHVEAARRPASTYLDGGRFTDAASLLVDLERRAMFEAQGHQLETRCYLTLTFLPPGRLPWPARCLHGGRARSQRDVGSAGTRRHWFRRRKTLAAIVHEQMTGEAAQLQQPEALAMAEDADVALQALGEGHLGYGYFTATFTVWDEDRDLALWQATEIARVLNEQGFAARIETLNTVEAWLGSLPGHSRGDIRRPVVSTLNVADMVCLSSIWSGPSWNHHLHGPPLLVAKARGNTPFRISTQPPGSDVGHQLIIGPTGAGKSTLLAFVVLQFLRYEGAQVFIFDKGASCRAAVLAVGGQFFDLGSPEAGIAFQPLRDLETPEQLTWAVNWLAMLLRLRGVAMTQDVYRQLRILTESPPEDRTLSVFSGLIQELDVRKTLEAFTLSGPYGHLLDAVEAGFTANRVQAFEMERFMKDPTARDIVVPVLTYLFHRLERHFDGRPTLLFINEAWSFLLDQDFSRQIQEWLTRLRKKNVSVVLATQNLADITKSGIADTLIQQTMSRIHLPNDKALDPYVRPLYEGSGLNERRIATARPLSGRAVMSASRATRRRLLLIAVATSALIVAPIGLHRHASAQLFGGGGGIGGVVRTLQSILRNAERQLGSLQRILAGADLTGAGDTIAELQKVRDLFGDIQGDWLPGPIGRYAVRCAFPENFEDLTLAEALGVTERFITNSRNTIRHALQVQAEVVESQLFTAAQTKLLTRAATGGGPTAALQSIAQLQAVQIQQMARFQGLTARPRSLVRRLLPFCWFMPPALSFQLFDRLLHDLQLRPEFADSGFEFGKSLIEDGVGHFTPPCRLISVREIGQFTRPSRTTPYSPAPPGR